MKALLSLIVAAVIGLSGCSTPSANLSLPHSAPSPTFASALTATPSFVTRAGNILFDNGLPFRAVGANRADLLAGGPQATVCRRDASAEDLHRRQLGTLMQMRAAGASVARLWAFQSLAGPGGDDFSHLDALIDAAHEVGMSLILVLENHYPGCSRGEDVRDADWYAGGFTRPYDGYAKSFEQYASEVTRHYADEPAILMWQIINEAHVPGHPELVRNFHSHMAQIIHLHDRNHLIAAGGHFACEDSHGGRDYAVMAQAEGIDVLDVHDFGEDRVAWPGCLARAKEVADNAGLLLMVGESGVRADPKVPQDRAEMLRRKMDAAADAGVSIYLVWSFNTAPAEKNQFDILQGDPVIEVLQQQAGLNYAMRQMEEGQMLQLDDAVLDAWYEENRDADWGWMEEMLRD